MDSDGLIRSDAETGEYREGTVLYLSDLPENYGAAFKSAVEVYSTIVNIFLCPNYYQCNHKQIIWLWSDHIYHACRYWSKLI